MAESGKESESGKDERDLENGDVKQEGIRWNPEFTKPNDTNEEYANLVRYIATTREGRRKSTISAEGGDGEDKPKKKPWWAFWRGRRPKGGNSKDGAAFVVPDEWIETDIKKGLPTSEIEPRRKKTGWNELTTEKENLFLKYLSYFTGPILYGDLN